MQEATFGLPPISISLVDDEATNLRMRFAVTADICFTLSLYVIKITTIYRAIIGGAFLNFLKQQTGDY